MVFNVLNFVFNLLRFSVFMLILHSNTFQENNSKNMDNNSEKMIDLSIDRFVDILGTSAPVPGGGGVSALVGSLSSALCAMVASLTTGKKKYAEYQADIDRISEETKIISAEMKALIQKDAEVFQPLSEAYGIPKENPEREQILEEALKLACSAPMDIICEACKIVPILEELVLKGSKIALSDVGVAASCCKTAIEGGVLNVYINTKLMKDREYAQKTNLKAQNICHEYIPRCQKVYETVADTLK